MSGISLAFVLFLLVGRLIHRKFAAHYNVVAMIVTPGIALCTPAAMKQSLSHHFVHRLQVTSILRGSQRIEQAVLLGV